MYKIKLELFRVTIVAKETQQYVTFVLLTYL